MGPPLLRLRARECELGAAEERVRNVRGVPRGHPAEVPLHQREAALETVSVRKPLYGFYNTFGTLHTYLDPACLCRRFNAARSGTVVRA